MKNTITNLSKQENAIINWRIRTPHICSQSEYMENISKIEQAQWRICEHLEQLNLLLEKFPRAFEEKKILEDYKNLKEYAKSKKIALQNCYSYVHKIKKDINVKGDINLMTYGIRIVPTMTYNTDQSKYVTITGYARTDIDKVIWKEQLNLSLNSNGIVGYINLLEQDSTNTFFTDQEVLKSLYPDFESKIYNKHK